MEHGISPRTDEDELDATTGIITLLRERLRIKPTRSREFGQDADMTT
jgi:hypothetical protein